MWNLSSFEEYNSKESLCFILQSLPWPVLFPQTQSCRHQYHNLEAVTQAPKLDSCSWHVLAPRILYQGFLREGWTCESICPSCNGTRYYLVPENLKHLWPGHLHHSNLSVSASCTDSSLAVNGPGQVRRMTAWIPHPGFHMTQSSYPSPTSNSNQLTYSFQLPFPRHSWLWEDKTDPAFGMWGWKRLPEVHQIVKFVELIWKDFEDYTSREVYSTLHSVTRECLKLNSCYFVGREPHVQKETLGSLLELKLSKEWTL